MHWTEDHWKAGKQQANISPFQSKQTFHHLSPTPFTKYITELLSEGGKGHLLKNVFQPQSSAHITLCSPPFLVIPKFSNKSSVYSFHISSTKALFSFYIKITGQGQLRVQLKTTEMQESNNRSTQRTVVERDSLRHYSWNSNRISSVESTDSFYFQIEQVTTVRIFSNSQWQLG